MRNITLNPEQRLYVIATEGGMRPPGRPKGAYRSAEHEGLSVSCFGFDNARDHAQQIAQRLDRPELMPTADDAASLTGYEKYLAAVRAWGESAQGHGTYFDPGTDPRLARVLETCRRDGRKVRLVLGDTRTGASWLDEFDVVGTVGRSTGLLKVPLLVEPGEAAGTAILCAHVLALIDWDTGLPLYRHPRWQPPELRIRASDDDDRPWAVVLHEQPVANFDDIGKAGAYLAFMRGASVEPRVFR